MVRPPPSFRRMPETTRPPSPGDVDPGFRRGDGGGEWLVVSGQWSAPTPRGRGPRLSPGRRGGAAAPILTFPHRGVPYPSFPAKAGIHAPPPPGDVDPGFRRGDGGAGDVDPGFRRGDGGGGVDPGFRRGDGGGGGVDPGFRRGDGGGEAWTPAFAGETGGGRRGPRLSPGRRGGWGSRNFFDFPLISAHFRPGGGFPEGRAGQVPC